MAQSLRRHGTEQIRNIAFVGHAGAGKTTLIEALLAKAGAIRAPGGVDKGTTVTDYTEQEKRVGHSLEIALCHLEHADTFVNLIDTPGYPDFMGRALGALPAVETAAVVIGADHGIELVAQRMMEHAKRRRLARLIVVNKIDAEGADLEQLLREIRATFGQQCLPLNLPARRGQAVADCFFEPAEETPDFSTVGTTNTEIVDQVVELDDELMERYLEQGQALSLEQLHDPFERALRRGHLIPVCFVSATTGAGLRQLLRIFTQLMPNPLEGNPPELLRRRDGASERLDMAELHGHFLGHVFRIAIDPYVGRIATLRVHQGTVKTGDQVFLGERRKAIRLAHLYRQQGKELEEIPSATAGDICAAAKIEEIAFDDVLHSSHDEDEVRVRPLDLPAPMYGVAIELTQRGQEKKLSDALHKIAAEDPSLRIEFDSHANETVVRGMGELHLRLVLERMENEFGIEVSTRPPKIAYRETVALSAEGHHRHKKQTGGAGQFGEVYLRIEPLERGQGIEFVDAVVGGAIPGQYIPAVEKGIRQVVADGAVAGYPMQDIRVTVYDGKHHSVDSKEVAFIAAGRRAFLDAVTKAQPVVLEPIAKVAVTTPGQYVGDITGHLAGIRGRIAGSNVQSGNRVRVEALVPLAELGDYQTMLKSLTGGEGTFTLELDHYETAPPQVQRQLENGFHPHAE